MNNSITSINVFNVLKSFAEKFQFLSYRDRKKIVGISNELLKVEIKEDPIKLMSDILSVDEDEIGLLTGKVRGKMVYSYGTQYIFGAEIVYYRPAPTP